MPLYELCRCYSCFCSQISKLVKCKCQGILTFSSLCCSRPVLFIPLLVLYLKKKKSYPIPVVHLHLVTCSSGLGGLHHARRCQGISVATWSHPRFSNSGPSCCFSSLSTCIIARSSGPRSLEQHLPVVPAFAVRLRPPNSDAFASYSLVSGGAFNNPICHLGNFTHLLNAACWDVFFSIS